MNTTSTAPIGTCVRWRTQFFKIVMFAGERFLLSPPPPPPPSLRRLKSGRILGTWNQDLTNVSGLCYSRQFEFQEELMNFLTTWLFWRTFRPCDNVRLFGLQFGLKVRGVGRSPGPLPWIRHWFRLCPNKQRLKHVKTWLNRVFSSQWLNNVSKVNTLSVGLFVCTFNFLLEVVTQYGL